MPLVNAKDLLGHASRHGYAVCAFDMASLDFLAAGVQAAENCRAPVILSVAEPHLEYLAVEHILPAVEAAARRATIPVAIQFNRAASVASAARAIGLGCNSIAVNGAGHTPEEHIVHTRTLVEMAHAWGVPVEGVINSIVPLSDRPPAAFTVIREYVESTGIDFLNIATGPAAAQARIDFTQLIQIRAALALPLCVDTVKEFTDDEYRLLIENGVAKIHHYAGLSSTAGERMRQNVRATPRNGYLRLMKGVQQALSAEVDRCLRLAGSAGRAPEVLSHCRPSKIVEHCILYNVATSEGEHQVRSMLANGRKRLGAVAGVRNVFSGRAARADAQYQYCWLVRCTHPDGNASYRDHPDHINFADEWPRPLAPEHLSIDFEEIS